MTKLLLAPIQGITDFHFRNAFQKYFQGIDEMYSPYLRPDHKMELRKSKIKDILPENNKGIDLIPQIMTNSTESFLFLIDFLKEKGYNRLNWNLGCPFPMVTNKKLGSGLLPFSEEIDRVLNRVISKTDMEISIKMRLGFDDTTNILEILPKLNQYPISKIIIHPRTGMQKYKGNVFLDEFEEYLKISKHKICYNGDINSVSDHQRFKSLFPKIDEWMLGRGLVANPFLAMQIKALNITENPKSVFFEFQNELVESVLGQLSGDSHLLSKMKAYWEYFSLSFSNSRKVFKLIKKSKSFNDFNNSLSAINKNEDWLA